MGLRRYDGTVVFEVSALVFDNKNPSVIELCDEIGVELVAGCRQPEGVAWLLFQIAYPVCDLGMLGNDQSTFGLLAVHGGNLAVVVFFENLGSLVAADDRILFGKGKDGIIWPRTQALIVK